MRVKWRKLLHDVTVGVPKSAYRAVKQIARMFAGFALLYAIIAAAILISMYEGVLGVVDRYVDRGNGDAS